MNLNTAKTSDPIWDSRNSDEPTMPLPATNPARVFVFSSETWDAIRAQVYELILNRNEQLSDAQLKALNENLQFEFGKKQEAWVPAMPPTKEETNIIWSNVPAK